MEADIAKKNKPKKVKKDKDGNEIPEEEKPLKYDENGEVIVEEEEEEKGIKAKATKLKGWL